MLLLGPQTLPLQHSGHTEIDMSNFERPQKPSPETGCANPLIGWPSQMGPYFALGYGGITYSSIDAQIIRDLHTGRSNPNLEIFAFDR